MTYKIYTKTGDKGETSIIGGTRLLKSHPRIESYGNVDELNSFVGLLRDQAGEVYKPVLFMIQDRLFVAESLLATDPQTDAGRQLPVLTAEDILMLEQEIDKMNVDLPELRSFILPGGHPLVSLSHVCRTVCRRAERSVIALAVNEKVDQIVIQYLNRLSDYFFVLSRRIAFDNGIQDMIWKPHFQD